MNQLQTCSVESCVCCDRSAFSCSEGYALYLWSYSQSLRICTDSFGKLPRLRRFPEQAVEERSRGISILSSSSVSLPDKVTRLAFILLRTSKLSPVGKNIETARTKFKALESAWLWRGFRAALWRSSRCPLPGLWGALFGRGESPRRAARVASSTPRSQPLSPQLSEGGTGLGAQGHAAHTHQPRRDAADDCRPQSLAAWPASCVSFLPSQTTV